MPLQPAISHQGGLVFHVPSDNPARAIKEDGKAFYVCDLTSYDGKGKCDCRDYRIEKEKQHLTCKHLERCWTLLGKLVAQDFIRKYGPTLDT